MAQNMSKPFKTLKSSTSHPKNGHGMVHVGMLINQLCLFSVVVTHFLFQTCQNPSVEKWRSAPPAPCPFRASVTEDATLTEAAASHSCAGASVNLRHGGVTLDGLQPMAHGRSPMIYHTWWFIPLSKWVITPVISGLTLLIPFITGVITHLLSGMNHQVGIHRYDIYRSWFSKCKNHDGQWRRVCHSRNWMVRSQEPKNRKCLP